MCGFFLQPGNTYWVQALHWLLSYWLSNGFPGSNGSHQKYCKIAIDGSRLARTLFCNYTTLAGFTICLHMRRLFVITSTVMMSMHRVLVRVCQLHLWLQVQPPPALCSRAVKSTRGVIETSKMESACCDRWNKTARLTCQGSGFMGQNCWLRWLKVVLPGSMFVMVGSLGWRCLHATFAGFESCFPQHRGIFCFFVVTICVL